MNERTPVRVLRKLVDSLGGANRAERRVLVHKSRVRLFWLLFLFDALLITAVLLSFQGTELVNEVVTLEETREVYATRIIKQTVIHINVITEVVPYGSTR